jgi:hypothetical protein
LVTEIREGKRARREFGIAQDGVMLVAANVNEVYVSWMPDVWIGLDGVGDERQDVTEICRSWVHQ